MWKETTIFDIEWNLLLNILCIKSSAIKSYKGDLFGLDEVSIDWSIG